MEKHLNASSSLFILFRNGNPLLHSTSPKDSSGIFFLTRDQAGPFLQSTSFAPVPAEIDEGDKEKVKHYQSARLPLTLPGLVFLGVDDRKHPTPDVSGNPTSGNGGGGEGGVIGECGHVEPPNLKHPDGVSYFAIDVDAQVYGETIDSLDEGKNRFVESRLAGNVLDGWQANLFAQARALIGESRARCTFVDFFRPKNLGDSLRRNGGRLELEVQVLPWLWFPDVFALVWMETRVWIICG